MPDIPELPLASVSGIVNCIKNIEPLTFQY